MEDKDIEIVNLSDDTNNDTNNNVKKKININFDLKKYKKPLIIGVPIGVLVIVIIIVCVIVFNKKPVVLQNVIGEKVKLDTKLDLKGIFKSDNNQYDSYGINNLSKAIINGNKIYYSYSPNYCVYDTIITCDELEEEKNECELNREEKCSVDKNDPICIENYCEDLYKDRECTDIEPNPNDLCTNYYNTDTDYNDLVTRYVMSSNLDGSNINELTSHASTAPIEFAYSDKSIALYYSNGDDASYLIDLSNDNIDKIKETYSIVPYPLSNDKETILINKKNHMFTLNFYNYNDYIRSTKQMNLYNNIEDNVRIIKDVFNNEDIYTISSSKYDLGLDSEYNGVYKNGKLFYQFRNDYEDMFLGESFLYIITTTGYKIRILKINKGTGEEHTPLDILKSNKKINDIEYITNGNDNLTYINVDNTIYTFNSLDDSLTKTDLSYYNIESTGTYNNYIYFYVKTREANDFYDLVLYNTVTKEDKVINSVEYFTINNGNLYTVENIEGIFELYKYPIY